jgi:hypothetical protein
MLDVPALHLLERDDLGVGFGVASNRRSAARIQVAPPESSTARSNTLRISRRLPGHAYACIACTASGEMSIWRPVPR